MRSTLRLKPGQGRIEGVDLVRDSWTEWLVFYVTPDQHRYYVDAARWQRYFYARARRDVLRYRVLYVLLPLYPFVRAFDLAMGFWYDLGRYAAHKGIVEIKEGKLIPKAWIFHMRIPDKGIMYTGRMTENHNENEEKNCGLCGKSIEEGQETATQSIPAEGESQAYDRIVHVACVPSDEAEEDEG